MASICAQSPFKPINISLNSFPLNNPSCKSKLPFVCNFSLSQSKPQPTLTTEPTPILTFVPTFAPATVANLGPGFDFLGCAVDGLGNFVSRSIDPSLPLGQLSISSIFGNVSSKLPKTHFLTVGIATLAAMKLLNIRSVALSLSLQKGLPLWSGLSSSAASAAAASVAVNSLFGSPLSPLELVQVGLESEDIETWNIISHIFSGKQ